MCYPHSTHFNMLSEHDGVRITLKAVLGPRAGRESAVYAHGTCERALP